MKLVLTLPLYLAAVTAESAVNTQSAYEIEVRSFADVVHSGPGSSCCSMNI